MSLVVEASSLLPPMGTELKPAAVGNHESEKDVILSRLSLQTCPVCSSKTAITHLRMQLFCSSLCLPKCLSFSRL